MRDYASELPVYLELDLLEAGWDGSLNPYPGMTKRQYTLMSLRRSLVKKLQPENTFEQDRKALELFLMVNSRCRDYVPFGTKQLPELEYGALCEARDFISRLLMQYDEGIGCPVPAVNLHAITDSFGFGPGASIGSATEDFLSKVGDSTMAATETSLQLLYLQAIHEDRVWADVESIRLVNRGFTIVQGSRLSFVPKSAEISRTICTEPLLNMMFQKGIGTILERTLQSSCGIDLRSQPFKNRILARIGSETGRFGTIDLSSASDSMSQGLVRDFFPSHINDWLQKTRSPVTILPDGTTCELHMVSSMGNAFTFPLQTLFFLSLVYGAYRMLDIKFDRPTPQSLGSFAVFGDDIIVDYKAYDLVVRLLEICGFRVNVDKSFNTGDFRESCGQDFYQGYNVRGVYLQHLRTKYDLYSAINRLNDWSARHGILLHNVVSRLAKGLFRLYVPMHESETSGIRVPLRVLDRPRRGRNIGSFSYRAFWPRPWEVQVSSPEHAEKGRQKVGGCSNPSAILLSALAGTLRRGRVVRRVRTTSFRLVTRETPCWDASPTEFDSVSVWLSDSRPSGWRHTQVGHSREDPRYQLAGSIQFALKVLAGVTLPMGHPGWVDPEALDAGSFGTHTKYVDDWKVIYETNLDL